MVIFKIPLNKGRDPKVPSKECERDETCIFSHGSGACLDLSVMQNFPGSPGQAERGQGRSVPVPPSAPSSEGLVFRTCRAKCLVFLDFHREA